MEKTMKDLCLKGGWGLVSYYKLKQGLLGESVSSKGQPYFLQDQRFNKFLTESVNYPFKQGASLIGRVWDSKNYEWCPNVQIVDPTKYARRSLAIE